jgi:adenine-specific DNA methylase
MRVLQVQQGSATELPYPDNFFDAVLTDPPYYDNVPYSRPLGLFLLSAAWNMGSDRERL